MFLPIYIHTATASHDDLIDYMNLTCIKNAQTTRTTIINSKNPSKLSQGLRQAFVFFKSWRRRTLSDYPAWYCIILEFIIISNNCNNYTVKQRKVHKYETRGVHRPSAFYL